METIQNSPLLELEENLNNLIADIKGMNPEDVTIDFVMRDREENIYPTWKPVIGSVNGGHTGIGVETVSTEEIESVMTVNRIRELSV